MISDNPIFESVMKRLTDEGENDLEKAVMYTIEEFKPLRHMISDWNGEDDLEQMYPGIYETLFPDRKL